jgi:hypothetical protein
VDAAYPSTAAPECIVSVTYTKPDMRGHSNENKLQLKVGELILLKGAHPEVRVILVIGGNGDAWLPYVLKAFRVFFDEVLLLWEERDRRRLAQIGRNPTLVPARHGEFWQAVCRERASRTLAPMGSPVPNCSVRFDVMDALKAQRPIVYNPSLIANPIARLCMRRSFELGGAEWDSYTKKAWAAIEMSRNYFNPLEAAVELSLVDGGFEFQGGVARDVEVPSLLHELGMTETKVSEDFVLQSDRLRLPVYIQCKASGGGRSQTGKNIQNRTKEQTTRSIMYACKSPDGESLIWHAKAFHWISVVDGDWGVSRAQPLKYVHMLQMAGYDKIFAASELLSGDLGVRRNNPLVEYLEHELACRHIAGPHR